MIRILTTHLTRMETISQMVIAMQCSVGGSMRNHLGARALESLEMVRWMRRWVNVQIQWSRWRSCSLLFFSVLRLFYKNRSAIIDISPGSVFYLWHGNSVYTFSVKMVPAFLSPASVEQHLRMMVGRIESLKCQDKISFWGLSCILLNSLSRCFRLCGENDEYILKDDKPS